MIGLNTKEPKGNGKEEKGQKDGLEDQEEIGAQPKEKLNIKMLLVIGVVIVVAIAAVSSFFGSGGKGEDTVDSTDSPKASTTANPDAKEEGYVDYSGTEDGIDDDLAGNSDSFVQGDPEYEDSTNNTTSEAVFGADDFVRDLKGAEVPAVFSVKSRDYVKTHVSYVAKRAIIDDGMEMYWLDVTYKKKKYRVQAPFYYFKDLDSEGICRVEIEVLNLEGGGQIISYMQVIDEQD